VKISDVYPTGEAILIQDNAIRMRWREGGLTPVYMESGVVYEVTMYALLSLPPRLASSPPSVIFGTPLGSSLLATPSASQSSHRTIQDSLSTLTMVCS
jgi:hypothetical protein